MRSTRGLNLLSLGVVIAVLVSACGRPGGPASTEASPIPAATAIQTSALPTSAEPSGMPVVIDTDAGMDDVIAILYLLMRPDVDVRAITVSGTGLAHCEAGMSTVLGLVALTQAGEIPVACGRDTPLQGDIEFPESWRSGADYLATRFGPLSKSEPVSQSAVEVLEAAIRDAPGKASMLTLGPLTTPAEVFLAHPELAERLEKIVIMGGAVGVLGNVEEQPTAEWNIYVDPHAANIVLNSGAPILLVPLDATNQAPITPSSYKALEKTHGTPAAEAVYTMFTENPSVYQSGTYYYWDPMAAVLLADQGLAEYKSYTLRVDEEGAGYGSLVQPPQGATVKAARRVPAEAFELELLGTLNGGLAVEIPKLEDTVTHLGAIRFEAETHCRLEGVDQVQPGTVTFDWVVDQQQYGLAAVTLAEGKTFEDLDAWPSCDPPPWIGLLAVFEDIPESLKVEGSFFASSGPIYFVCFVGPDDCKKIGVLGPIEVK